jgi:hypothetical protein
MIQSTNELWVNSEDGDKTNPLFPGNINHLTIVDELYRGAKVTSGGHV